MSRYFKDSEFACKCGCGLNAIDPWLIHELDELRIMCGFPFVITSGCRCEEHNRAVGGSENSAHTPQNDGKCKAADISIDNSTKRHNFLRHAMRRFNRVGIAKTFIHVDMDKDKPQGVTWLY